MKHALLTVFGKDRPGIIANVTGILFQHGCNLEDVSMTILEGEFAMMMIVCLSDKKAKGIQKALQATAVQSFKLSCFWKEFDGKPRRGEKHLRGTKSYVITVMGHDRTGIVYHTSRVLAGLGLNITDLNSKILGHGRNAVYAMMLEVDIPKKVNLAKFERTMDLLAKKLKVECRMKPVERISF